MMYTSIQAYWSQANKMYSELCSAIMNDDAQKVDNLSQFVQPGFSEASYAASYYSQHDDMKYVYRFIPAASTDPDLWYCVWINPSTKPQDPVQIINGVPSDRISRYLKYLESVNVPKPRGFDKMLKNPLKIWGST